MIHARRWDALWRLAFVFALLGVTVLALLPSGQQKDWFPEADKLRHGVAFAALYWLAWRGRMLGPMALVGLLLVYGVAIELAQALTSTRSASACDVLADGAGLLLAWLGLRRPAT